MAGVSRMMESPLPDGLPETDRDTWLELNAAQRERVRLRAALVPKFIAGKISAEEGAAQCEIARSRFYAIASAWQKSPSISALAVQKGVGGEKGGRPRLDPTAVNALQAVLPKVVRMNKDAPVSELVRQMVDAANIGGARLPGVVKLRQLVEAELRRAASTGQAGNHIRFDCTAVNLPRTTERPWILFACLDVGVGAILGADFLPEPDIKAGYSLAAAMALERINGPLLSLPWAERLANLELVAGPSDLISKSVFNLLWDSGLRQTQLKGTKKRYGVYLRKTVDRNLGRIEFTPDRTENGEPVFNDAAKALWSESDAREVLMAELRLRDDQLLEEHRDSRGRAAPPEDLVKALRLLSRSDRAGT